MNIQQLKGIGEKTAALLSRLSVYTVKDLVGLYPRAYDVYEKPVFVQEAVEEHASEIVSIEAVVARNVEQYSTPRMKVLSTVVRDEQGTSLKCTWFNMPFLRSSLKPGAHYVFRGQLAKKQGSFSCFRTATDVYNGGICTVTGKYAAHISTDKGAVQYNGRQSSKTGIGKVRYVSGKRIYTGRYPQCVSACGTQFCRTADTFSAVAGRLFTVQKKTGI